MQNVLLVSYQWRSVCVCVSLSVCLHVWVGNATSAARLLRSCPWISTASSSLLLFFFIWCYDFAVRTYVRIQMVRTVLVACSRSLSLFALTRRRSQQSLTQIHTHTYAHNEECMVCEYLEQICVFIQLQTGKPRVRYFSLDFDFEFDLLNISQTNKIQFKYMQTNINKPRFNSSVFYQ